MVVDRNGHQILVGDRVFVDSSVYCGTPGGELGTVTKLSRGLISVLRDLHGVGGRAGCSIPFFFDEVEITPSSLLARKEQRRDS